MSIPFTGKAYGLTQSNQPLTGTLRRLIDNGFVGTSNFAYTRYSHIRGGKTSNRRRLLSGTSTLWIPPSGYSRGQWSYEPVGKGSFKHGSSFYYETMDLPPVMFDSAYVNLPLSSKVGWFPGLGVTKPDSSHLLIINARNGAVTKALNDLGSSKAQLGEALATARQTADMFFNAAWDLIDFVRKARNGRLAWELRNLNVKKISEGVRSGKYAESVAKRWLEFHYGWKPLASDVFGTYELLREQMRKNPALLVHGRGSFDVVGEGSGYVGRNTTRPDMDFAIGAEYGIRVNLTGKLKSGDYSRALNQAGLINPLALAWELIPFSFVLDWIVPVGSVLNALSAPVGLDFVGGHRTERYSRSILGTIGPEAQIEGSASLRFDTFGFDRYVYWSFPMPAPYVKPFYTGADRIATILSLITVLSQSRKVRTPIRKG